MTELNIENRKICISKVKSLAGLASRRQLPFHSFFNKKKKNKDVFQFLKCPIHFVNVTFVVTSSSNTMNSFIPLMIDDGLKGVNVCVCVCV